jgi:hypothetical protein
VANAGYCSAHDFRIHCDPLIHLGSPISDRAGAEKKFRSGPSPVLRSPRAFRRRSPSARWRWRSTASSPIFQRPDRARRQDRVRARDDPRALELIRHDAAHVLAEAVQTLWPGTQVTIGPVIENGFYYDFFRNEPFTPEDLTAIEKKMREIIARDKPFTKEVWSRDEAKRCSPTRARISRSS